MQLRQNPAVPSSGDIHANGRGKRSGSRFWPALNLSNGSRDQRKNSYPVVISAPFLDDFAGHKNAQAGLAPRR